MIQQSRNQDAITKRIQEGERITALAKHHQSLLESHEDTSESLAHLLNLADRLTQAGQTLAKAQSAFEDAVGAEGQRANWNARATLDLERVIWHAQARIAESFGPEMLRLYGIEESPPAGERTLATYAHNAVTLLRASSSNLPGHFGDTLDTEQIAQAIEQPLWALNDYLATLDSTSDNFKRAMAHKEQASAHWMRLWRGVSTMLEAQFILAERSDLAAKICPRLPALHPELDTEHFEN